MIVNIIELGFESLDEEIDIIDYLLVKVVTSILNIIQYTPLKWTTG